MITAFLNQDGAYTGINVVGETKREAAEFLETYVSETTGIDYRVGYHFNVYQRFMPNRSGGYSIDFVGSES